MTKNRNVRFYNGVQGGPAHLTKNLCFLNALVLSVTSGWEGPRFLTTSIRGMLPANRTLSTNYN